MKIIEKLLEYSDDHIVNILTEGLEGRLNSTWTYYGIFENTQNYERGNESHIVDYVGSSYPERAQTRAKSIQKNRNDDRYPEEKRYTRYSVRKLTKKYLASEEFATFFNNKRFKDIKQGIIDDAKYAHIKIDDSSSIEIQERDLQNAFREMVTENKLTSEDLEYWNWANLKILGNDSSESISASSRTSVWSTTYNMSIDLNGKTITSRYHAIGDVNRI